MKTKILIIIFVTIIALVAVGFFIWQSPYKSGLVSDSGEENGDLLSEEVPEVRDKTEGGVDSQAPSEEPSSASKGTSEGNTPEPVLKIVNIPFSLKKNCIGFLTSFPQEIPNITLIGAGWTRPHPGPFSWGEIEKVQGSYDFSKADDYVKAAQINNVAVLATIWPFADWDQENNADCKVGTADIFYPSLWDSGIPAYRCKPQNFQTYRNFLTALVERYDGDGINDMAGLTIPIKYWEVLNEPEMKSSELTFFIGDENDYFEILKESYNTIKQACADCRVLHGGNAGSQSEFLSFWDKVFSLGGGNYFDIANTHIIGEGDVSTLNAKPFKDLLDKYNIQKPIWVTEVQYENSSADVRGSVSGALANGAEKIFFVSFQVGGLSKPVFGQFASEYQEAVQLCPNN